jgi:lipopolysaccharide export LptBFGC system permease protein LptF
MRTRRLGLGTVFAVPAVLFVLSLIGLVGALLADGAWDGIGAALLALAVATAIGARLRGPGRPHH